MQTPPQAEIKAVIGILKEYFRDERKTTLNREAGNFSPFQMLAATIISQQLPDEKTEQIVNKLFQKAKTPEEILALPKEELERILYQSRFYEAKAAAIRDAAKKTLENGSVPDTKEELMQIRGVGPKTANVVLRFSYNKPVIPVDVNVHRIANRLGWMHTKNPEQTEEELMNLLPKEHWADINGILMLHGKSVCTPLSPKCSQCPVADVCKKVGVEKSR